MAASKFHFEEHRAKLKRINDKIGLIEQGMAEAEAIRALINKNFQEREQALKKKESALAEERALCHKNGKDLEDCQKQVSNLRGANPTSEPKKEDKASSELIKKLVEAQDIICTSIKDSDEAAMCKKPSENSSPKEVTAALNNIHIAAIKQVFSALEVIERVPKLRNFLTNEYAHETAILYEMVIEENKDKFKKCNLNPITNYKDFKSCQDLIAKEFNEIIDIIRNLSDTWKDKMSNPLITEEIVDLAINGYYYN